MVTGLYERSKSVSWDRLAKRPAAKVVNKLYDKFKNFKALKCEKNPTGNSTIWLLFKNNTNSDEAFLNAFESIVKTLNDNKKN